MRIRTASIAVLAAATVLAVPGIATSGEPDVAQQLAEARRATLGMKQLFPGLLEEALEEEA